LKIKILSVGSPAQFTAKPNDDGNYPVPNATTPGISAISLPTPYAASAYTLEIAFECPAVTTASSFKKETVITYRMGESAYDLQLITV
jgi:hypothetical protein